MIPVSPNTFNMSIVTATSVNEDNTVAVTFLFQGASTTVNFPVGSTVKPGDLLTTDEGVSKVWLFSGTQILGE